MPLSTQKKLKEAELVAGGEDLRVRSSMQLMAGQTIHVGGEAISLSDIHPSEFWSPSPASSILEEGGGTSSNEKSGTKSSTKHSRETLLNELTALADDAEGKKYMSKMKHFEMDLHFHRDKSRAAHEDRQHE